MDWVVNQWDSLQKRIQASRPSSSAASSINFPFERPEKINDHIYEVHRPEGRPSMEIVFFHGLQFEGSKEAYLTTWLSAEGSELWPTWILKDVPNARILLVSYDACAQRNNEEGRMDMFLTCENLVASLTEGRAKIGGDGCPVILVGHSVGGLVIKELCVKLHSIVSKVLPHSPKEPVQNLLQNIRGLFYYACPHLGSRLADTSSDFPKGPLFEGITTLNHEAQRRNEEFRELHKKYGWKTYGIVEGRPTTLGQYEDFFVTEASARCDVDDFFTYNADHFNICRPKSRSSSNFSLLSNFVASVLEQVQDERSPKMSIPNGVHGLEGRVKAIMDLLKQGGRRLGIVGMGGIGKTTLARAVYDTISASFEYTCFLRDVKKSVAKKDDLEYLQNKIIKCLSDSRGCKVKKHFNWTKLKGRKVLFVLDDVDCESQVRVMLESDGLSDESCVIVTSRESRFLRAESFQCYFVEALDEEDSKRIFCLNAFHKEVAQPGYELRVARFTKRCGGLPLALRVAGKYLFGQKQGVWDEGLEKLKQSESLNGSKDDELSSVLMVCYQSLAETEQDMFLDVATCFHNQDVETLNRAWSVCGWASPESALGNLVDKGFVTIEDTITIEEDSTPRQCRIVRMHEVLRDLGRSIACPKTENVGTHTRLCYDLSNPLPTAQLFHEANAQVKVLIIHRCEDISIQSLQGLKELKILWLEDVNLHGSFNLLPPNLCYMKISDSRLSIYSEGSHSRSNGESGEREKKRKRNRSRQHSALRQLEIHTCKLSDGSLDSLGQCQALECLEISSLSNWTAVPQSFGKLPALKYLRVVSCHQLESLRPLGHLLALKYLVIQDCLKIKAIPKSLGRLKDLEHLALSSGCLKAPGQALGQLRALRHFESTCCQDWEGLMNWLERVKALTKIVIHSCVRHKCSFIGQIQLQEFLRERSLLQGSGQVQLPMFDKDSFKIIAWPSELLLSNFGTFGRARMLLIKDCPSLTSLPDILGTFQNLEDLQIVNCGLQTLPDTIGDLKALRTLSIVSCIYLRSLPDSIGNLYGLRDLQISCGPSNSPLNYLRQVKGLRVEMTFCQFHWSTFDDMPFGSDWMILWHLLRQLHSLQTLVLHGCMHEISSTTQFLFLEYISRRGLLQGAGQLDLPIFHEDRVKISSCNLEQIPSHFLRLRHASSVLLTECRNFEVLLDTLGEFRALRKIEIESCRDLKTLPDALGKLEALEHLRIEGCRTLEALPDSLGQLRALRHFTIKSCGDLKRLPDALGKLEALEHLRIKKCWTLEALPDSLGKLQALKELSIEDLWSLETLPDSLGKLRALKRLVIKSCWNLRRLPDALGKLEALKELSVGDCRSLETLPDSLGKLGALERLVINTCRNLRRLPDALGKLEALKELSIANCSLETLPDSLGKLGALERLVINTCRSLRRLPDALGKLEALKELIIANCSLETLPDSLGKLGALERFVIKYCRELTRLPDALGELEALKELIIEDCSLETLPDSLGKLGALKRLELKSCRYLRRLPDAVGKLEALKELSVEDCRSLETLPDSLGKLGALEWFVIKSCRYLRRLPDAVGKLEALKELSIE